MTGVLGRRIGSLLAAAALAALLASSVSARPRVPLAALSPLERGVLVDVNAIRAQHRLAPLHLSAALTSAARAHSQQMAADGYFGHQSADGTAFWQRIQRFYASGPWSYWSVGENLLWSSPDVDAQHALQMWMQSPEHRANLLNPRWREIGVAAVHASAAPGVYHGLDVTIVTTDFGVRR